LQFSYEGIQTKTGCSHRGFPGVFDGSVSILVVIKIGEAPRAFASKVQFHWIRLC